MGDVNPLDRNLQTFNALFPRGAYFGQFSLIEPFNHTDLHFSAAFHPTAKLSLNADWINFWRRAAATEFTMLPERSFARAIKATLVRRQYAVETNYILDRHTTLSANYSHFNVGKFLRETTPAENTNYFAAWLTYKF